MISFVLGGARSGKSREAERLALASNKNLIYIATAEAGDDEMRERIAQHQNQRCDRWLTIETPVTLAESIKKYNQAGNCILVDCLTLWLSNCLHHQIWPTQRQAFLDQVSNMQADIILVSNEVGSGVVPLGELSRRFVDESGWLHQKLAEVADEVKLIVAGLPLKLK